MSRHTDMDDGLMLSGYQKKLNTMKKKFFVLYKDTTQEGARLEYFDSMKKFKSGSAPKRVVKLENCFNINRRLDTKYEYVIALATKDGGFGIVLENESEMLKWLQALLSLQRSMTNKSGSLHPKFEHVWQVAVQKKNLPEDKIILGSYHVCLSPKFVTFIRIGSQKSASGYYRETDIEIPLNTVRRCGDSHCLFYMEVGRQCSIGPGELWMETEDPLVAQNMHKMISSAMSAKTEVIADNMRKRSSSVTETSKPISFMEIGNNRQENKNYNIHQSSNVNLGRGRCDSLPSRSRISSDHMNQSLATSHHLSIPSCPSVHRPIALPQHSTSPPLASTFGSTERKESIIKIDDREETGNYLPFRFKSAEGAIPEENSEDLINSDNTSFHKEAYMCMAPVVKLIDLTDKNKMLHAKQITTDGSMSSVNSLSSIITSDLNPQVHSNNSSRALTNDFENEERPTRSYSIGSKIDKNRIQRLGNSNEILHDTNAMRVRAFSVGSRAKIPKCDLQRAVLFPRSRFNQSYISNNSLNFGPDDTGYKLELNTNFDKKSTSAPILIQNGQVSMDCMSDLMEIDFSKSSNHKSYINAPPVDNKGSDIYLDDLKQVTTQNSKNNQRIPQKSIDQADNGYLEMKPVESLINKPSSTICNEYNTKLAKSEDFSIYTNARRREVKNTDRKYSSGNKVTKKQKDAICMPTNKEDSEKQSYKNVSNQLAVHLDESQCLKNMVHLSSVYSKLSMDSKPKCNIDHSKHKHAPLLDGEKTSRLCNDDEVLNEKNVLRDKVSVNESPKIKSDSFVEGNHKTVLSNVVTSTSGSTISRFKNELQNLEISLVSGTENDGLYGSCTVDNKAQLSNIPSYELYYAKLDLPQRNIEDNVKCYKADSDLCTIKNRGNNSYAKIDFDHSSDSSSSSKTLNI